jgi:hypothetical protein
MLRCAGPVHTCKCMAPCPVRGEVYQAHLSPEERCPVSAPCGLLPLPTHPHSLNIAEANNQRPGKRSCACIPTSTVFLWKMHCLHSILPSDKLALSLTGDDVYTAKAPPLCSMGVTHWMGIVRGSGDQANGKTTKAQIFGSCAGEGYRCLAKSDSEATGLMFSRSGVLAASRDIKFKLLLFEKQGRCPDIGGVKVLYAEYERGILSLRAEQIMTEKSKTVCTREL